MRKTSVYVCDICRQENESDGFPPNWYEIDIKEGGYYSRDDDFERSILLEKDCCSMECVRTSLGRFLGGKS